MMMLLIEIAALGQKQEQASVCGNSAKVLIYLNCF
jgi:hypothetical protein